MMSDVDRAELRNVMAALRQDVTALQSHPMIPATIKGALGNLLRALQILSRGEQQHGKN